MRGNFTQSAIKEMVAPGVVAIATPVLIGFAGEQPCLVAYWQV